MKDAIKIKKSYHFILLRVKSKVLIKADKVSHNLIYLFLSLYLSLLCLSSGQLCSRHTMFLPGLRMLPPLGPFSGFLFCLEDPSLIVWFILSPYETTTTHSSHLKQQTTSPLALSMRLFNFFQNPM